MKNNQIKVVSVYGYGRFGKLWADILKNDFQVKVYSRRGLKPDEVSQGVTITSEEDIFNADAVFFCVAISSLKDLLQNSVPLFKENTVFFDTCSVKVKPAKWMNQFIPQNNQIIATHPMFGPDSYYVAKEALPIVMCNVRAEKQLFNDWCNYFTEKKLKVVDISPDEHDKMVAYSQGITHYVGRVLADLNLSPTTIDTLGYKKLMEIVQQTCNDNWQLFVDLQKYNPYTKKMREELHQSLEKIYTTLNMEDTNGGIK